MAASQRSGKGAVPFSAGTTFRVWAPFADKVAVAGSFNGESRTADPLFREPSGYWSADTKAKTGDRYWYVITNGTQILEKNDPWARELTHSKGESIVPDPKFDWEGDDFRLAPWNELVIYEMHVGTFNDTPGGPVGQFQSIQKRLGYLRDLGVNAIELMPIMEFMGDLSWGYNVAQPYAVETSYGGPKGLKELVKQAHRHGIGVILDLVFNHFGPQDLDLWQFDGWGHDGHGGIFFYNDDRRYTPWGETRPDFGRPEVRDYLRENALMWLEEYHIDGLRFDQTTCIRREQGNCQGICCGRDIPDGWRMLQELTDTIRHLHPGKITIAEDLSRDPFLTRPSGAGGAGMGAQWSDEFVDEVRETLIATDDPSRNLARIEGAIYQRDHADAFSRVIYTESHDEVANGHSRLPAEVDRGDAGSWFARKRSTLGAALVFTAPGIPMLFQGQELLEDEYFRDTDPIDWTKLNRFAGIHRMYRDLARLRRNWHNQTRGLRGQHVHVHHRNDTAKVLAMHRFSQGGPGDDVVVVFNFSNQTFPAYRVGFPSPGDWGLRFNSDAADYGADFAAVHSYSTTAAAGSVDRLPFSGNVGLGPYSTLIFSQ